MMLCLTFLALRAVYVYTRLRPFGAMPSGVESLRDLFGLFGGFRPREGTRRGPGQSVKPSEGPWPVS
ncbi:hypothetical protein AGABI1DRAFT_115457 [Agaricus bisporus var. burnettii JB137-S8]|uniref:Uncharacterized protein n=1 Tax=Agaricus bisporus var. burnettii (strain JB137-S8 / ATCC MYA-4627 / FGSC 10392) TaxID=597362 RepID=K5XQG7_AGABU|nr:uncharacterized protein AGABI1DRAFT_115457 [Agaricus bisporus var. burnettii JB137-S8]EKM77040.1 hypothetical protein AGABI1DRAFT_115457 [Agaricus bisporus var. burnettii JB137-S8]